MATADNARTDGGGTRDRVLALVEAAERPLAVSELTEAVGVHHTVVRQHLARLAQEGRVVAVPEPPRGRGRPRTLWAPHPDNVREQEQAGHFQRLAALLAEAVAHGIDAREAGRRAGKLAAEVRVAASPAPDTLGDLEAGDAGPGRRAAEAVEAESARLGFEPRLEDCGSGCRDVVLGYCPFADVAAEVPETVCQLHLGIAEGVVDTVGGAEVTGITIRDPRRAGCRLHLRDIGTQRGAGD